MNKLITNYHTHTFRCGHAEGKDEEYVLSAINENIKILGFSDHIPYPNLPDPHIRQNYEMLDDYVTSINKLKEKYKDKIEIHLGYESEYFSTFKSYYKDLLTNKGIEYLILGQHCFLSEKKEYVFYNSFHNNYEILNKYVDDVIEAMNTGLYLYVAHPDFIMNSFDNINNIVLEQMVRIVKESIRLNIPLEINCAGIRYKENGCINRIGNKSSHYYPYDEFFALVGKYNAKVIIGIDAHNPKDITNEQAIDKALEFVYKYNLNLIEELPIYKKTHKKY